MSKNNQDLLLQVKILLQAFETEGTCILKKKHADFSVILAHKFNEEEIKGKEAPFVYIQPSLIEFVSNLDISRGENMQLLGQKVFHVLEDSRPLLEEISMKEIQRYWWMNLALQDALYGKQRVFDKALSLREKRDSFSTIGYLTCKEVLRKWYDIPLNLEYRKPPLSVTLDKEDFVRFREQVFFLLLQIEKEASLLAAKENVSLTFSWREGLFYKHNSLKPCIVFEEDFFTKGMTISEEYPEHFFLICIYFLNVLKQGFLIKNLSLKIQDCFWQTFAVCYVLYDPSLEKNSLISAFIILESFYEKNKDDFYKRGLLVVKDCFKRMTNEEIEEFYSEEFREKMHSILKEQEKKN